MSWEENNNIDIGYEKMKTPEDYWREGEHITKNGEVLDLEEMSISHLKNTIKYFSKLDTTPLKKELEKRNI